MCGICGFIGTGDISILHKMTHAIEHRGPDAEGIWYDSDKGIYLGHRRLSIIDIRDGGQPMWTSDHSLCIVFNGEIYNYLDLRAELESLGHTFSTSHSDTEVLLYGYRQWGKKLTERLNGMWAFAILDLRKNELFLSRDRFGKKPLFYTFQNGTFVFASELNAIKNHPCATLSIDKHSLQKYFGYNYIPAPRTLYQNVYKLPGGYNAVFDISSQSFTSERYWSFELDPFEIVPKNPEESWGEELRSLLEKAVKRRLISDVPLGVFLSGGIDSSSIAAFASKVSGTNKIKTFSVGFDESSYDETYYSSLMSKLLDTDHNCSILSIDKARTILENIVQKLDEPLGDNSLMATYLLCQETRKHVTVAVGGDGADELFAGYDPIHALRLAESYSSILPKPIHKALLLLMSRIPTSYANMSLDFRIKRTLRGLSFEKKFWNPVWMASLAPSEISELFNEPIDIEDLYSEVIVEWENCKQSNIIDQTLQYYTNLYLQDDILVKVDRASMMNSLEVRTPFLDIDLVNFVRRIPHNYKYRNGHTKYILKKAMEPVLPKEILYRPKKGFGVPVGKWFKEKSLCFDNTLYPFVNSNYVDNLYNEHLKGKADHRALLWNFWVLKNFTCRH